MKKKLLKPVLLLICFSTLVLSCHKEDQLAGPDVYVVGWISPPTGKPNAIAAYWKNGNAVQLSDGTHNVFASSIFVSGPDVYVAGSVNNVPVYWKNGVEVDGNSGLLFVQGSDVYLAIVEYVQSVKVAKYLKNGVPVILGDGIHDCEVNSIYVSGNDVYVAGSVLSADGKVTVATYWKNGTAVTLGNGTAFSVINSIFILGNDVYAAGEEMSNSFLVAKYWKNGTPVSVTNGTSESRLYSIFVSGTDVYVGGGEVDGSNPNRLLTEYWKNGVPTVLPQGKISFEWVTNIILSGSDVYAFIQAPATTSYVYKNGKAIPPFDGNDPNVHGYSMFVNTKGAGN